MAKILDKIGDLSGTVLGDRIAIVLRALGHETRGTERETAPNKRTKRGKTQGI